MEGVLELEWKDLSVAKANLKRIQEHYEQYQACESYFDKRNKQDIFKANVNKDWFVNKDRLVVFDKTRPQAYWAIDAYMVDKIDKEKFGTAIIIDEMDAQHQIILYTDDGKPWQIHAPWCGYFETLNGAEIVSKAPEEDGMSIEF